MSNRLLYLRSMQTTCSRACVLRNRRRHPLDKANVPLLLWGAKVGQCMMRFLQDGRIKWVPGQQTCLHGSCVRYGTTRTSYSSSSTVYFWSVKGLARNGMHHNLSCCVIRCVIRDSFGHLSAQRSSDCCKQSAACMLR